ncbi:hypothetical protein GE061_007176 [Apolygus lucorum]|uniref:Uncharacterized protein n=1 Tax=Apolygus lucorum TaxID=248454 RepID=A0A8S9WSS2_APOLU|nr:hypothetical protein GE061_007176 [Apolygus lucorum]
MKVLLLLVALFASAFAQPHHFSRKCPEPAPSKSELGCHELYLVRDRERHPDRMASYDVLRKLEDQHEMLFMDSLAD